MSQPSFLSSGSRRPLLCWRTKWLKMAIFLLLRVGHRSHQSRIGWCPPPLGRMGNTKQSLFTFNCIKRKWFNIFPDVLGGSERGRSCLRALFRERDAGHEEAWWTNQGRNCRLVDYWHSFYDINLGMTRFVFRRPRGCVPSCSETSCWAQHNRQEEGNVVVMIPRFFTLSWWQMIR